MGQEVFLCPVKFGESTIFAIWYKNRVIAMAKRAARRPDQMTGAAAFIKTLAAIGPCDAQCADEFSPALGGRSRAGRLKLFFNESHGAIPVAAGTGPIGGMNAGIAAERVDAQSRIVRDSDQA